jgi:hypothetical protein
LNTDTWRWPGKLSRRKQADKFIPAANRMAEADIRIAMWSGPRNISTAMMRAWGSRDDTFVVDEPFYAFYLKKTGADHPGAKEVIAVGETDWRKIDRESDRTDSEWPPHFLSKANDASSPSRKSRAIGCAK